MKKIFTFLAFVFIAVGVFAQTPEKMSYQAVIRNSSNQLVTNQQVGMQISILQGSANGTAVYVETQTPNTNANGLISIEIGSGSVVSGDFAAIDWANGPYFIQSETDPTGGTNYTITGTSQLLSVPYALHAKTAESVTGDIAETDPVFSAWDKDYTDLTNTPNLANVATSGNYSDLTNQPSIPEVYNSTVTFNGTAVSSSPQTVRLNQNTNKTITINQADVSGFITTETDPEFTNSEAAKITADDITDLGNLSGTNTGDQDLTTLATKVSLADSTTKVRSEIPDVSGFATNTSVIAGLDTKVDKVTGKGLSTEDYTTTEKNKLAAILGTNTGDQDLTPLATKIALADSIAKVRSEIPDASSFNITETDPSVPTGTQTGEMQYWNGTKWVTVAPGSKGQVLTFTDGIPTWQTLAGAQTMGPTDVYNPATGKIWMDRNLGASQVATSSTDAAAYGDLYQWGRSTDGHEKRTSDTTSTLATSVTPGHGNFIITSTSPYDWHILQNYDLWQGVNGINNPCPAGYRLPTPVEWNAEIASWSSSKADGAFASPLKLPMAGWRNNEGSVLDEGTIGRYSSSGAGPSIGGPSSAIVSFSTSINAVLDISALCYGISVRCIKD